MIIAKAGEVHKKGWPIKGYQSKYSMHKSEREMVENLRGDEDRNFERVWNRGNPNP